MTEADWLSSRDVHTLLAHLDRPPDDRKLRLYAVACCRDQWHHLKEPASRAGVEWAERFADGLAARDAEYARLEQASTEVLARYERLWSALPPDDVEWQGLNAAAEASHLARAAMDFGRPGPYHSDLRNYSQFVTTGHVHDIFGNSFRPVTFLPEWRTSTVLALAQGMYDTRDFCAMPILADALQDAGCEDAEVLAHCQGNTIHCRGCHVADAILGES